MVYSLPCPGTELNRKELALERRQTPPYSGNPESPEYRPDVDGLRAVAVLSVVAYHAFPQVVKGGFIGVDIFFVISGYLISSIIYRNLDRGTFTFTGFYGRRVRRIFPALTIVLAAVYAVGWVCLLSDEFQRLSQHIVAGAGFVSNLALWRESGYFDAASDTKVLLHLWSLGIEEQFYIVWPLTAWLLWRRRAHAFTIILLAAALSFAWSVRLCATEKVAAFYAPQSRFWELALGAALAHITLYRDDRSLSRSRGWVVALPRWIVPDGATWKNAQSIVGALLIAAGLVALNSERPFPGAWALVPTVGAVLLIAAGPEAWLNRRVLSFRPLVWIGLISYPLYLWHWPLLSLGRILGGRPSELRWRLMLVAASLLLSWLTFVLVEKPIRRRVHGRLPMLALVASMCVVGLVGLNAWWRGGLPFRRVNIMNASRDSGSDGGDGGYMVAGCGIPSPGSPDAPPLCMHDSRQPIRFAVIGDSKAGAIYGGLVRTSLDCGRWLVISGAGGRGAVASVLSDRDIYRQYQPGTSIAVKVIAANPQIEKVAIVTAARVLFVLKNDRSIEDLPASPNRAAALEGLRNTLQVLTQAGKKVVLVVDNPTLPDPKDCLARRTGSDLLNEVLLFGTDPGCNLRLADHLRLSQQYRSLLSELATSFPRSVQVFDTTEYLCDVTGGTCPPSKDGRLLYSFTDHISEFAATLVGRDLNRLMCSDWPGQAPASGLGVGEPGVRGSGPL